MVARVLLEIRYGALFLEAMFWPPPKKTKKQQQQQQQQQKTARTTNNKANTHKRDVFKDVPRVAFVGSFILLSLRQNKILHVSQTIQENWNPF